jgi:prepilin signal peptidase PulO-like enzyme (type II secretory pathway)
LLGAIGAWLGLAPLPAIVLGAALTGLAWVGLRAWRGRPAASTTPLPLGTMLVLATIAMLVWRTAQA